MRAMRSNDLTRKMYATVESENAPAPSAIADRSTVIHSPHGTRSVRLVISNPYHSTRIPEIRPTTTMTPRTSSQKLNRGAV